MMLFTFTLYNLPALPKTDIFILAEFMHWDKNHEKYHKNNQGKNIFESCDNDDTMVKYKAIEESIDNKLMPEKLI